MWEAESFTEMESFIKIATRYNKYMDYTATLRKNSSVKALGVKDFGDEFENPVIRRRDKGT